MHRLQPLSPAQENSMHTAAMEILNKVGVSFKLPEALAIFQSHGFHTEGDTVFFTEEHVLKALATAPAECTILARNPEKSVRLGGEHFAFGPAWGAPFVIDSNKVRRKGTLADQETMCKLIQTSDAVDFVAGSMAIPAEYKPQDAATHVLHKAITLTDKPLIANPCTGENGRELAAMARIVWGKEPAELEHPVCAVSINPLSPLSYADDTLEGLLEFARQGQALLISSMVLAGITGPVDIAGTAAQEIAESLAGIVLAQLIRPGVPCITGGTSCAADMRTGGVNLGGPESLQLTAIAAQMARYYKLPCRYGGNLTDSFSINVQAGAESALLLATPVFLGAHFIHQACGILGAYAAMSPEKFIIDEEVCALIRYAVRPVDVSPEAINMDLIKRVGPGGSYMIQPETAAQCRTAFFPSRLFAKTTWEDWKENNRADTVSSASQYIEQRLQEYSRPDMDPGTEKDLQRYVETKVNQ